MCHFFICLTTSEKINLTYTIITAFIFILGFIQLFQLKRSDRVKFTYKIDEDFFDFLNNPKNKIAKDWLLENTEVEKGDYDVLWQLLDEAEGIYSLMKRGVLDNELAYDFLSYYIESFYTSGKSPTTEYMISEARKEEGITNPQLIYIGIQKMHKKIVKEAASKAKSHEEKKDL